MNPLDTIKVLYHSPRWMELVEQGWTTVSVSDKYALMAYKGKAAR